MLNQFTIIFGRLWQTYTIALIFGIIISFAWMIFRSPEEDRAQVFDICLSALIGGIIIGRMVHVGLNWQFFADRTELIWQIHKEGGLNWQTAVIGSLIAGYSMAKLRRVGFSSLMSHTVIILPWIALISWYACATASCAYGASVERMADYPGIMTWLADDIYHLTMPRFATQPLGMMSSAGLLLIAIIFYWRGWLIQSRFWLILILLSSVSFGIGFLRGAYALEIYSLRAGQWLDIGIAVIAILFILRAQYKRA